MSNPNVSIRLPADVASDPQLNALAIVDGHTDELGQPKVGPEVVEAVHAYVEARRADPTLPQQVERAHERIAAEAAEPR